MSISVAGVLAELLPALNAASFGTLDFWTESELYEYADDAVKRLGRSAGVFVSRTAGAVSTSRVTLPAGHLALIHASWEGATLQAATVRELEALNPLWESATGTPERYVQDLGLDTVRLYPAPVAPGTFAHISQAVPADVSAGAPALAAPLPVTGYLVQSILCAARGREGDGQMPEIAEHCAERVRLYESVFESLWGIAR